MHFEILDFRYNGKLKQLEFYRKKRRINDKGYEIIKSDIEWLIDKLEKGGEGG